MPEMSHFERAICKSAPWRFVARELVLPWALQGEALAGRVLEIGGGSGAMAAEMLLSFPDLELTVTDFDESMVETARRRLHEFGNRVTVRQADATQLPFEDESFDAVVSFIMLHHVIDWEHAVAEAARVLKPGGLLLGYDLLNTPPLRVLHQAESSDYRMMHFGDLRRELRSLPLQGTVTRSLGGLTVRFALARSAAGSSATDAENRQLFGASPNRST